MNNTSPEKKKYKKRREKRSLVEDVCDVKIGDQQSKHDDDETDSDKTVD
jgi:hypothetical protein